MLSFTAFIDFLLTSFSIFNIYRTVMILQSKAQFELGAESAKCDNVSYCVVLDMK